MVGGGNKLVSVLAVERFQTGTVIVDNVVAVRPLEEYAQVEAFPLEVIGETTGVDGQTVTDNRLVFSRYLTVAVQIFQFYATGLNVAANFSIIGYLRLQYVLSGSHFVEVFVLIDTVVYIAVHLG